MMMLLDTRMSAEHFAQNTIYKATKS